MYSHDKLKYMIVHPGINSYLSPFMLSGSLIASGMHVETAYSTAKKIIADVPGDGVSESKLFQIMVEHIPQKNRIRYTTLFLIKRFLMSPKSKSPLFIFLGGLAGKTTLTTYLVQHLGINRVISIDEEKYIVRSRSPELEHLWQPTYESIEGYIQTYQSMIPRMREKLDENYHDYHDHKKWCYFWEGIYLLPSVLDQILSDHPEMYFLSIFSLPEIDEIRNRYMHRWLMEQGLQKLKKTKNIIDSYLENIEAIRSTIKQELPPVASFVIESKSFEEQLEIFYGCLHQKITDIANEKFPGWVERIVQNPKDLTVFQRFLET
ncbi:hypothetical protein HGA88_06400 [Candidatus Roizmanbacteria bacterium]|nr:hypothetical protein [Candidatus Roizmanbacteria bacterium]